MAAFKPIHVRAYVSLLVWNFRLSEILFSCSPDPLGGFRRFKVVQFEIIFIRLLTNMFYNAYLPCILLALVGMVSLFMSLDSFSERIILTSSILLSFYTIFGSLSGGLPKPKIGRNNTELMTVDERQRSRALSDGAA